jgi:hypothetical protein
MRPEEQGSVRIGLASGHVFELEGSIAHVIAVLGSAGDSGFVELQRAGTEGPIWVRPEFVTEIQR